MKKFEYMDLVDVIRRDKRALESLTNQSTMLEPSRARRKRPNLNSFRAQALSLLSSIRDVLQCSCPSTHVARGSSAIEPWRNLVEETTIHIVLQHQSAVEHVTPWVCKEAEFHLLKLYTTMSRWLSRKKPTKSRVRNRVLPSGTG